ncbi:MAG: hypothetical protein M3328_15970, partial [Chloroflexota bacterium]|nr:hypothetical protein [Chloroflexota bacterium]
MSDSNPFIVHWDGNKWTIFPVPSVQSGPLRGIYAAAPNDIWVVGEGGPHVRQMNILHWDGVAWRMVKSPIVPGHEDTFGSLYGIHGLGPNDIWAVGSMGNQFPTTLHWNGTDWTPVPNSAVSEGYSTLMDVVAVTTSEVWAVGFNDRGLIALRWNGSTWEQTPTPEPGFPDSPYVPDLFAVDATRPGDIWAVGNYYIARDPSAYRSLMLRYNDPCTTPANTPTATTTSNSSCQGEWQQVTSPNAGLSGGANVLLGVDARTTDDVWAVGYYSDTLGTEQPLVERWNGVQWLTVPSPSVNRGRLYSVTAVSATDAWAVGSYRTAEDVERYLIMRWNGITWNTVQGPDLGSNPSNLRSVTAVSANDIWAVGYYLAPGTYSGSSLALHWNGSQWSQVATPASTAYDNQMLVSVSALASNDVWAAGTRTDGPTPKPLVLHWNGSAWQTSEVGDPSKYNTFDSTLTGIVAIAPNDVWAVGYQFSSGPYAYVALLLHWNGSQWTLPEKPSISGVSYLAGYATVGSASYLMGVPASASNDIWAVGYYK